MSIRILTQKEAKEEKVGRKSIMNLILDNIDVFCRKQVARDFARDEFDESNLIVVAFAGTTPRGFAFLEKETASTLYLHLICAAIGHPMHRRSKLSSSVGGKMIKTIIQYAKEKRFARIKLAALRPVITLYHYFGWRFIRRCKTKENPQITHLVLQLANELKPIMKKNKRPDLVDKAVVKAVDQSTNWRQLRYLLEKNNFSATKNKWGQSIQTLSRYAVTGDPYGIDYTEDDLRKALPTQDEAFWDLDIEETRELKKVDTQDDGYDMILCLTNKPSPKKKTIKKKKKPTTKPTTKKKN